MKIINDNFTFYKGENWINLSELPRKKTKSNEQILWDESIGYNIEYFFEGISGYIKILDCYRKNKKRYLQVEVENKKHEILSSNFKNCEIKKIVTDGYKHDIGFIINNCEVIGKRLNPRSKEREYKMLCLSTKLTFYRRESRIDGGASSPYISGKYVYEGNWLFNEKDVLPFLKDVNDAKKYTKLSRREINCVCPNCKTEYKKTKKSDIIKMDYCKKKSIRYVEVDCRVSDYDFILKNINETELKNILTFYNKEKIINIIKELEQLKEVEEIINLYTNGKGLTYISKKVGLTTWKIEGLLKRLGYIAS